MPDVKLARSTPSRRLAEPVLRLSALAGWVASYRYRLAGDPSLLHWATPLTPADDDTQGVAACGALLPRAEEWWTAGDIAVRHAADEGTVWRLCDTCLYWAGGLPVETP